MTADEWVRWLAFDRRYTIAFGFREMDALFAHLCLRLGQFQGVKKKSGGTPAFDDYLLFKPKETRSPVEFMRALVGNRVKRK